MEDDTYLALTDFLEFLEVNEQLQGQLLKNQKSHGQLYRGLCIILNEPGIRLLTRNGIK